MREWRATHPLEAAMLRIRASAKKRKIKFTLTIDEFRVWAKESGFEASKLAKEDVTIDRVDSSKGYEMGNLQILTNVENGYKSDYVATKIGRTKLSDLADTLMAPDLPPEHWSDPLEPF